MPSSKHPYLSTPLEWLMVFCSFWFVGGLYLDGWAHNHIKELETFFTPWHAVFYSGYAAVTLALCFCVWRNKTPDRTWLEAVPVGYGYSLVGVALFFIGGMGDMLWHQIFGIEQNIDALLSPTHLLLATALLLMVTGGLRSWWTQVNPTAKASLLKQLPMIFSVTAALSMLTFMTQFSHFIVNHATGTPPTDPAWIDMEQSEAISGYLFQTIVLMGCVFLIMRRARIVFGACTILFTLNMIAMAYMRDGQMFIPAALITGLIADILARNLYPLHQHLREFRTFAFIIPAILFLCYFITLLLATDGIWWSIHLWTGSIFIAGAAGLLTSFLIEPMRE